jgi:hypothetical protein
VDIVLRGRLFADGHFSSFTISPNRIRLLSNGSDSKKKSRETRICNLMMRRSVHRGDMEENIPFPR